MTRRQDRINGLLREELSWLLAREVNDPRLSLLVTITRVDTSVDLRYARVFVSVMGSEEEQITAVAALQSAAAFLQHQLKSRVILRFIPTLLFSLDKSLEQATRTLQVMDTLSNPQEEPRQ